MTRISPDMITSYQQVDMAAELNSYPDKISAHGGTNYRGSVISVSTANSKKSNTSRSNRPSTASSRTSYSSVASDNVDTGKKYRFDTAPKLVRTPWEQDRSKRAFSRSFQDGSGTRPTTAKSMNRLTATFSAEYFKRLPSEVYDCIASQLAASHVSANGGMCFTCCLADLNSLCLTSKAWERSAKKALYGKIWLPVDDTNESVKQPPYHRLKQLRRTLRSSPHLAALVKELHIPELQWHHQYSLDSERELLASDAASLIMACPNLEEFTGLQLTFDHDYDRLSHALATRKRLRRRVWVLKGIEEHYDSEGNCSSNARPIAYDGSISNGDVFLNSHQAYSQLDTLLLFGQDTGNLDYRSFVGTFRQLQSLQHLLISKFSATQFNDRTMAALPLHLRSLRLQDLPGVTARGLNRLVNGGMDFLISLALINLNIKSAPLINDLLHASPYLTRFTLEQSPSPVDPENPGQPFLYSSSTVRSLYWDISPFSNPALSDLAYSIANGAFPSLTSIRAPCDDGSIQRLCRPRASIARPSDSLAQSSISLRSSLAHARLAAQDRLDLARLEPLMRVIVTDEDGTVLHKYTIKNYLGDVQSKIHYVLHGSVRDSGILELEALLGDVPGKARPGTKTESCCGPPSDAVSGYGKKEVVPKSPRSHRPRLRAKHVGPAMFF